jgi:acyl-CoA reductase-like NAD-dependent aldehyde dehydrogenase
MKQHIEDAISKGARTLHQSAIPESSEKASFFPITVLADVTEGIELFNKEAFGSIRAMTKFDASEEEALRLANKTEYGLGSCVYTKDMEKAQRVACLI